MTALKRLEAQVHVKGVILQRFCQESWLMNRVTKEEFIAWGLSSSIRGIRGNVSLQGLPFTLFTSIYGVFPSLAG